MAFPDEMILTPQAPITREMGESIDPSSEFWQKLPTGYFIVYEEVPNYLAQNIFQNLLPDTDIKLQLSAYRQRVVGPLVPVVSGSTAVHFDGAGEGGPGLYRTTALIGVVDGPLGICSFWLKSSDVAHYLAIYCGIRAPLTSFGHPDNTLANPGASIDMPGDVEITLLNDAVTALESFFNGVERRDGNWHHILCAWNTNFSAGSRISQLAIDGILVSVSEGGSNIGGAMDVLYSSIGPCIGFNGFDPDSDLSAITSTFDMSEFYFNMSQTLDLTNGANILKFRTSGGAPANLGINGAVPTGTAPAIYLSVSASDDASQFAINRGTGGDFTITGVLTKSSSSPSD